MIPDFLAIGHVVRDRTPEGYRLGGAVTYAALTALKLGLQPAIATSAAPEPGLRASAMGVAVHTVASSQTTTFRNSYVAGRRSQVVTSIVGPITASDVPVEWRSAPLVLLAPMLDEVSYEIAKLFPDSKIVASIQGWLRRWDSQGRVGPRSWEGKEVMPFVNTAVVSAEDVGEVRLIDRWAEIVPVLIVTEGKEGARLHFRGRWHRIAPFPSQEIDPAGAGDVFAAAYLVRNSEVEDPLEAARFASCAAGLSVEAAGVDGIPTRSQVESRLGE